MFCVISVGVCECVGRTKRIEPLFPQKFDEKLFVYVSSNVTKIEVWPDIGTVLNKSVVL